MKLHYYRPDESTSNFGDELNKYIWEHYFPNFFDDNPEFVFFGIGTIVKEAQKYYSDSKEVIIFGSGVRSDKIKVLDNVNIIFTRGPLSAKVLNVPEKFITDPAILTPKIFPVVNVVKKWNYSFIPHFSSINSKYMKVFRDLGIHVIDPRDDVKSIINDINASNVVLTEAMHGAIVADAYRIPWIPIKSYDSFNYFKWNDWAQSHDIEININKIPRFFAKDNWLKYSLKKGLLKYRIKKIKLLKPYLSQNEVHETNMNRIEVEVEKFKTKQTEEAY